MWHRWLIVLLFLTTFVAPVAQANQFEAATTPTTDFTDNGDGTVTHKITGLTWKRCAEGQTWSGSTCSGTAKSHTWAEANALASGGWRLPRIDELVTLVERDNYAPATNTSIFPNTPKSSFWSASADAYRSGYAWEVYFYNGGDFTYSKTNDNYVRLVRGGQSLDSSGLYTPTSDFSDNGDGTVTHKKTSLTWKRCAEGQTWSGSTCSGTAQGYIWSAANALGTGGWRLPTQNELLTIVEWSKYSPVINTTIFPSTPSSYFWSASAYANDSGYAWYVYFYYGLDSTNNKPNSYYVRLVRGGQSLGSSSTPPATSKTDSDRIFDWAEKTYPQFFPARGTAGTYQSYTYRFYPSAGIYLATNNGRVIVHGGLFNMLDVGAVKDFVLQAQAAGF